MSNIDFKKICKFVDAEYFKDKIGIGSVLSYQGVDEAAITTVTSDYPYGLVDKFADELSSYYVYNSGGSIYAAWDES